MKPSVMAVISGVSRVKLVRRSDPLTGHRDGQDEHVPRSSAAPPCCPVNGGGAAVQKERNYCGPDFWQISGDDSVPVSLRAEMRRGQSVCQSMHQQRETYGHGRVGIAVGIDQSCADHSKDCEECAVVHSVLSVVVQVMVARKEGSCSMSEIVTLAIGEWLLAISEQRGAERELDEQ